MLREIKITRAVDAGEEGKRWYQDEYFDLFVWHKDRLVTRFELRYGKQGTQRTLGWKQDMGFTHTRVDMSDRDSLRGMAPMLNMEKEFDYEALKQRFLANCTEINFQVSQFVIVKMSEYARIQEQKK